MAVAFSWAFSKTTKMISKKARNLLIRRLRARKKKKETLARLLSTKHMRWLFWTRKKLQYIVRYRKLLIPKTLVIMISAMRMTHLSKFTVVKSRQFLVQLARK